MTQLRERARALLPVSPLPAHGDEGPGAASSPFCTHHDCRLDAAQELRYIIDTLGRFDLEDELPLVMTAEVICRHVPRDGEPQAPLPPLREDVLALGDALNPLTCPACGSTNVAKRGPAMVHNIETSWKDCEDCGHTWDPE